MEVKIDDNRNNGHSLITENRTNASTNDISSTKIPLNYTEIYEKILNEISDYCLSDKQYEELYSNKLRAGLVSLFFQLLLDNAIKQIGLSELRNYLKLKKQKINLNGTVKEEFEDKNRTDTSNTLIHLHKKVESYTSHRIGNNKIENEIFLPEEVSVGEQFLDRHFPQVRKLFKLKFEEMNVEKLPFNNSTIDTAFGEFMGMEYDIWEAFSKSNRRSSSFSILGFHNFNCSDPNFIDIEKIREEIRRKKKLDKKDK
uniref:Uncharacterized protein n=1 Tax=Meloidogyne enterolobii TaxID=390850 RepID=A0A6V7THY4_MELEN|nr:unnamed protein product [Meloidogyne enterolobii]